jgi:hypothetical protein
MMIKEDFMSFKKGEALIFYDQPVTFIDHHGQESSLIKFGENAEELVSTNIYGETYVSTRMLRRESEYPIKMMEEASYYIASTLKNEASFMKRFFPKNTDFTLIDLYIGTVYVMVKLRDNDEAFFTEEIDIVDFFSWFDNRGNYASKT